MRRAAVDCAHVGFNRLELIQGFLGKAGQIHSNRCRRQLMRRSQAAGRYEKGEWVRGIEFELARSECVWPGTKKTAPFRERCEG